MTTTDVHELIADITARLYAYHSAVMDAANHPTNSREDSTAGRRAASDLMKCAWEVSRRMGTQAQWWQVDRAAASEDAPPHVVRSMALAQARSIKNHRKEQGR